MKSSNAESWGTKAPVFPFKATPKHSGIATSLVAVQNPVRKGILISYPPMNAATPPHREMACHLNIVLPFLCNSGAEHWGKTENRSREAHLKKYQV
jgi:hypothetical protein